MGSPTGRRLSLVLTMIVVSLAACSDSRAPAEKGVIASRTLDTIPAGQVLELSFTHQGVFDNKFRDVTLEAVFTAPGGGRQRIQGFFYGGEVWKIRIRPHEVGGWSYTYLMTGKGGLRSEGDGAFAVTPSATDGPIRRHPDHPYRWVFASGKPFFPVGFQNCVIENSGPRPPMVAVDGEKGGGARWLSQAEYFSLYGQAGFNLLRFSQRNCSYALHDDYFDEYHEDESLATDEVLSVARRHGFRVMFGFFGGHGRWVHNHRYVRMVKHAVHKVLGRPLEAVSSPHDREIVAKEQRFIEYCVARWGVYVDFWELLNERKASDEWTTLMADHVRAVDPDRKPISTSWEKPLLPAIDINAPHWYESESELESDLRVKQMADDWKQAGKPVIVGEHGNRGMNWDPRSGLRMRVRLWTALFQEISLVFWNTNWAKDGMFQGRPTPSRSANIYLGPEERGYVRVLQDFSARLDANLRMAAVEVSLPGRVRGYGLRSTSVAAAYLHHVEDHVNEVRGLTLTLDGPDRARSASRWLAEWIEPATGNVVERVAVRPGRHTLEVPPFTVDLALLIVAGRGDGRNDQRLITPGR